MVLLDIVGVWTVEDRKERGYQDIAWCDTDRL